MERQAFARIHRIGQTKEVHTAKLVVAGSMDEHILAMQTKKMESIRAAVGDECAEQKRDEIYDMLCEEGDLDRELGFAKSGSVSDGESGRGDESDSEEECSTDSEDQDETETESDSGSNDSDDDYNDSDPDSYDTVRKLKKEETENENLDSE